MGDEHKPQDEAGPEEVVKVTRALPDPGDDAEGHGVRQAIPDADKPGPDDVGADKPGPDDVARWSDRTRKVGIVPVSWD